MVDKAQPKTKDVRQFCIFCELPLGIIKEKNLVNNLIFTKEEDYAFMHIEHILDLEDEKLAAELLQNTRFLTTEEIRNDDRYTTKFTREVI